MSLKEAFELYGNLGLMGLCAFLVIYYVVIPKLSGIKKQEDINNKVYEQKMLGRRKEDSTDVKVCLTLHPFFKRCDNMIKFEVYNINFGGKIRNLLFMDMLQNKIGIFKDDVNEFVKKDFSNGSDWTDEVLMTMERTIKNYNDKWKELGVPQLAIDKFNDWHEERIRTAKDFILKIGVSDFYSTIYKKNTALMDVLTVLFNQTCEDMYDSAYALNGELTGKIYKSQPIEPLKHK